MSETPMAALADAIEAALEIDDELADAALAAISTTGAPGTDGLSGEDLDSTDQILTLIYHTLPGWTVNVKGKAWMPNGHWTCSLRKTSSRDNDEYVGVGRGPTLPHALLAALFRVLGVKGMARS